VVIYINIILAIRVLKLFITYLVTFCSKQIWQLEMWQSTMRGQVSLTLLNLLWT